MFYTLEEADNMNIFCPDIYFTVEYGRAVQSSDGGRWECYYIPDKFLYVYLVVGNDIKALYGYAGMYIYPTVSVEEYMVIRKRFLKDIISRGYKSEFLLRNPYISTFTVTDMNLKVKKVTYGMNLSTYDTYWNSAHGDHRNMTRKAIKLGYTFSFISANHCDMIDFRAMYNNTCRHLKTTNYYYFNDDYFYWLEQINGLYIAKVSKGCTVIGMSLFFIYPPYIHYHLSCNTRESNCITDYLLNQVIKYCFDNFPEVKFIHLGGGITDGDQLAKFKRKICPTTYDYYIYSNEI